MKILVRGVEPQERVNLIMQLTKIGSENIRSALKRLNEVAAVVEKIK
jgi:hypothetical protein